MTVNQCQAGDMALIVGADRKQFVTQIEPDRVLQTHRGVLRHEDLIGLPWGSEVLGHTGESFTIFKPTMRDLLLRTKRSSQIIFPKDIGYILLRLSIGPGSSVIEAGTGSGALTTALAWAVGPEGHVYSYDRRKDMQALARRNLERLAMLDRVSFRQADIREGFRETNIESLFLDLPHPHRYLEQSFQALRSGGTLGAILPTSNQVSELLAALEAHPFAQEDVCEIMLRFYKPVAERLRPMDRMVAHTGYLVFSRTLNRRFVGGELQAENANAPNNKPGAKEEQP